MLALAFTLNARETVLLKDDFSEPKLAHRRAERGDWKFTGGMAVCSQDDALYEQFQKHGPILFYDHAYDDATVRFDFKPQGVKMFIFTANNEKGHVFRFLMTEADTTIFVLDATNVGMKFIPLVKEKWPLKPEAWTSVTVSLRGTKATVKIGDSPEKTYEHVSLATGKTNFSVGFSFGTLAVSNLTMTE